MPSTSEYNLRPRRGVKVIFRPTNEKMTQQGGPVGDRGIREHQCNPYSEEQAMSSSRNTRSRSVPQQHCQERKGGANRNKSISLEVPVENVNYKLSLDSYEKQGNLVHFMDEDKTMEFNATQPKENKPFKGLTRCTKPHDIVTDLEELGGTL
ncbi:hypothetical protein TNCV_2597961 [Trichonephila clavipes]|nr:hypothetical protein TNCV_2597961 [Trichonephila clavipes]